MKNKKQIAALVGCILGGIVVGAITVAHYLGKTEGKTFPMFIFTMAFGTLIAGVVKYLIDKRRGINATTSKLTLTVILCVIVGLLIGAGIGYHYFSQTTISSTIAVYEGLIQGNTSTNWQFTKIEPTKEMVEKIVFYENGKQEIIDLKSEGGKGIASLLTRKLHELNLQARCVFSEKDIQEIKQKDRVMELIFKKPIDITISQWVEPEERYHIPTDEKGYRILENVKNALFILEDNLGEGLEGHVLVGHEVEGIGYSCWVIQQEGSKEIKIWIDEINKIFLKPQLAEERLNVEEEEIVREAVELVWNSGKIPYKCPLKVLESDLVVEKEKVKEVHLTLDCGGKTLKASVDWQNKKVISVENDKMLGVAP